MPTPNTFQKTNNASQLYIPCKAFVCTTNEAFRNAISNIPKSNGLCILTKSIDEVTQDRFLWVHRTFDWSTWILITRENSDPIKIQIPFYRTPDCINFICRHTLLLPSARISYADIQALADTVVETEDHKSQVQIRKSIFEALNQLIESVWADEEQRLTPSTRKRALTI